MRFACYLILAANWVLAMPVAAQQPGGAEILASPAVIASPPATDLLIFRDGTDLTVQVLEVGPEMVTYQRLDGGPLVSIVRSELFMIRYANGSRDVFGAAEPRPSAPAAAETFRQLGRSMASTVLSDGYRQHHPVAPYPHDPSELALVPADQREAARQAFQEGYHERWLSAPKAVGYAPITRADPATGKAVAILCGIIGALLIVGAAASSAGQ